MPEYSVRPGWHDPKRTGADAVCVYLPGAKPPLRFTSTLRPGDAFLPPWEYRNGDEAIPSWTLDSWLFLTVLGPLRDYPDRWGGLSLRVWEKPTTEPVWISAKDELRVDWSPRQQQIICRRCERMELTRWDTISVPDMPRVCCQCLATGEPPTSVEC